jgi:hypothetical protein
MHAVVTVNMFAIYGAGQVKKLTELIPDILNQLGPDSLVYIANQLGLQTIVWGYVSLMS